MSDFSELSCCAAGGNCSRSTEPAQEEGIACVSNKSGKECGEKTFQSCCNKNSDSPTSYTSSPCGESSHNRPSKSCCGSKGVGKTEKIEVDGFIVDNAHGGASAGCSKERSCCDGNLNKTCSSKTSTLNAAKSTCKGTDDPSCKCESSKLSSCCSKAPIDHPTKASFSTGQSNSNCCADGFSSEASQCNGETSCCQNGCYKCALHLKRTVDQKFPTKRSTFYVEEICCATEIAAIRSIVGRLDGVTVVKVNPTTKMVYVDHDLDRITATDICDALNRERFGAHVEKDAGLQIHAVSSFVTSILAVVNQEMPDKDLLVDFVATFDPSVVQSSVVDIHGKRITLVHNALLLPVSRFAQALSEALNVQVTVLKDGGESLVWDFENLVEKQEEVEPVGVPSHSVLRPTVALAGVLWVVSMLSFIGGNWEYLKYVALLSVAFGLPPIALKAAASLRAYRFDINCLMTFATIGALALQDFTEGAAVTFLFALSEWLEVRATSRARNALSAILQLRPERANLIHPKTGEIIVVPVGLVPVGALVSVKAGDKIPCDGVVMEGHSTVDESSLTGESRPVRKGPNDIVSGGTINSGNTQMTVQTIASAEDSAVARLIRLVEEAQANRSDTEKLVDEFARIYTPVIVTAAISMCTIPWAWGHEIGAKWTELGLVLIVIACPCALIISTPVSYVAGLAATAQRGVLVKGGAHLEALGMVTTVCFDKTGTLTQGKFQLLHFAIINDGVSRKEALEYLVLMEDRASHPLARALIEGAQKEGVKIPKGRFVRNHTFLPGEGVIGTVDGEQVYVGNERLFERLGLYQSIAESERQAIEEWGKIGSVGFMSIGTKGIVCAYCVADAIRTESTQVLKELKELGINTMMLTGDNHDTAMSIGVSMGLAIHDIKSQLFPEEKLAIVSDLKSGRSNGQSILMNFCSKRQLVLMCGDGVNDAPALAAADVGVAVAGSALAMETADVTLLDSNLTKLVFSMKMGRRVIKKIKENVAFSLIVKFLVLGFALVGKAALWAAIASDVGAMLLVTLNSMMLLPSNEPKLEEGPVKKPRMVETSDHIEEVADVEESIRE